MISNATKASRPKMSAYFGFIQYSTEDPSCFDRTNNNKVCNTEDDVICDIMNSGAMVKMMDRIFLRVPKHILHGSNTEISWNDYFNEHPITTMKDMRDFLKQFNYGDAWFDIDMFKLEN